jgi:hypothetical protein
MSFKSILQNADIFNIILLMLGPHAMHAVRALEDVEHSAKETEWYGYFNVLAEYGLNDPYDWHVEKFGPDQYVAVYNGKPLSTFDTFYWMGSDPTSVAGRNPSLAVQSRREGPAPLKCWIYFIHQPHFVFWEMEELTRSLEDMLTKRKPIIDFPLKNMGCLFMFYAANGSTWIDPYHLQCM